MLQSYRAVRCRGRSKKSGIKGMLRLPTACTC